MADSKIVGKWQVTVGALAGFTYDFKKDGSFEANLPVYNVKAKGKYKVKESVTPHEIDMEVTEHTYGDAATGNLLGIYEYEGDMLKLKVNEPGKERWTDPSFYFYYQKI